MCFSVFLPVSNYPLLFQIVGHTDLLHDATSQRFDSTGISGDCRLDSVHRRTVNITALVLVTTDVRIAKTSNCRHIRSECLQFSPPQLVYKHKVSIYGECSDISTDKKWNVPRLIYRTGNQQLGSSYASLTKEHRIKCWMVARARINNLLSKEGVNSRVMLPHTRVSVTRP